MGGEAENGLGGLVQEDGMEEGGGEMRFRLPAAPSPGPLMFLLAACREVARAGGHTTGAVAVQLLEWELGNAVLEAFRCTHPSYTTMRMSTLDEYKGCSSNSGCKWGVYDMYDMRGGPSSMYV